MGVLKYILNLILNYVAHRELGPSVDVEVKTPTPEDRVLLIGINAYPTCPLDGCVNDVTKAQALVIRRFGIDPASIRVLKDADATTEAILSGLQWLAQTPAGGRALLYYSGHGVEVPTADGIAQAICPVDFDWTAGRMIIDKQFVAIFSTMNPMVKFNWVSDSCHSGDLTKSFLVHTPKFFNMPYHIWTDLRALHRLGHKPRAIHGGIDVGFVSGCRHDQTSADTTINGEPAGALSGYLLPILDANSYSRLDQIVAMTARSLKVNGYDQAPQCEGPRSGEKFL